MRSNGLLNEENEKTNGSIHMTVNGNEGGEEGEGGDEGEEVKQPLYIDWSEGKYLFFVFYIY